MMRWMMTGACALALMAAAPAAAWADQSNDNDTTTTAAGAPTAGAAQLNLACPVNLNVLGTQSDGGSCAPGAQSNSNSWTTAVAGGDQVLGLVAGPLVAPVTAALQTNVGCPVNVNVLSSQHRSGNCLAGPQWNSNTASTHVAGTSGGLVSGPLVAPITTGVGLNVNCPTNVNVLSGQESSGGCAGDATSTGSPPCGCSESTPPVTAGTPADSTDSGWVATSTISSDAGASQIAGTADSEVPGPPVAGALAIGRTPAGFPALGVLILAVLAAAAMAVRRLGQER